MLSTNPELARKTDLLSIAFIIFSMLMSAMFVAFADASNLILNYQYKTVVVHI